MIKKNIIRRKTFVCNYPRVWQNSEKMYGSQEVRRYAFLISMSDGK
jgi:hypothetical protein